MCTFLTLSCPGQSRVASSSQQFQRQTLATNGCGLLIRPKFKYWQVPLKLGLVEHLNIWRHKLGQYLAHCGTADNHIRGIVWNVAWSLFLTLIHCLSALLLTGSPVDNILEMRTLFFFSPLDWSAMWLSSGVALFIYYKGDSITVPLLLFVLGERWKSPIESWLQPPGTVCSRKSGVVRIKIKLSVVACIHASLNSDMKWCVDWQPCGNFYRRSSHAFYNITKGFCYDVWFVFVCYRCYLSTK